MFNNGLNQDTVYYSGLLDTGWQITASICSLVNSAGYAITQSQTKVILFSLVEKGRIEHDVVILSEGDQIDIWRKKGK